MAQLIRLVLGESVEVRFVIGQARDADNVNSPFEIDPGVLRTVLESCLAPDRVEARQ